eukprot:7992350-Pyramimonas_sp.AAC.1
MALSLCPPRASQWDKIWYYSDGSVKPGCEDLGGWGVVKIGGDSEGQAYLGFWAGRLQDTCRARVAGTSTCAECVALFWVLVDVVSDACSGPVAILSDSKSAVDFLNGTATVSNDNHVARLVRILWDLCRVERQ